MNYATIKALDDPMILLYLLFFSKSRLAKKITAGI
jgi:hypothetical protein